MQILTNNFFGPDSIPSERSLCIHHESETGKDSATSLQIRVVSYYHVGSASDKTSDARVEANDIQITEITTTEFCLAWTHVNLINQRTLRLLVNSDSSTRQPKICRLTSFPVHQSLQPAKSWTRNRGRMVIVEMAENLLNEYKRLLQMESAYCPPRSCEIRQGN